MITKLFTVLLLVGTSAAFANTDLEGVWQNKKFDIELSDSFQEIRGAWGDAKYDIDLSDTFEEMKGEIGNGQMNVDFDYFSGDIRGTLPCGKIHIVFSTSFEEVKGEICGDAFDLDVDEADVQDVAKEIAYDAILRYFPTPTRAAVSRYMDRYIDLR